jgi:hypothetical protein
MRSQESETCGKFRRIENGFYDNSTIVFDAKAAAP